MESLKDLYIEAPFIKDKSIAIHFEEEGYAKFYLEDTSLISELNKLVEKFPIQENEFYYSLLNLNAQQGETLQKSLHDALSPLYNQFFSDFISRNESFLVKPAFFKNEMFLHQDWTFTDIKKHCTATLWVPLQDVDRANGCMTIVPKSHRFFNQFISSSLETARIPQEKINKVLEVPMKVGEALIFNPLVFHGSYPNNTNAHRKIITAQIFPASAPYNYYAKLSNNQTKVYKLEETEVVKNLMGLVKENLQHLSLKSTIENEFYKADADWLNKI